MSENPYHVWVRLARHFHKDAPLHKIWQFESFLPKCWPEDVGQDKGIQIQLPLHLKGSASDEVLHKQVMTDKGCVVMKYSTNK